MAKKTNSEKTSSPLSSLKEIVTSSFLSGLASATPTIINKVFAKQELSVSDKNPTPETENLPAVQAKATTVWHEIGCSQRTEKYIVLALADGIIDEQEQEILERCATEDGVDIQEFKFLLAKALESQQLANRDAIKQLANAFEMAEKMANHEIKPDKAQLEQALPAIMTTAKIIKGGAGAASMANPVAAGSTAIITLLSTFIKEPSKLNEFKAEIIRKIEIPMLPEVLVDFFAYATSEIKQERQKVEGKGLVTLCSDYIFGKELQLEPVWQEKIDSVMTKALSRFGHDRNVMALLTPYRITPLERLRTGEKSQDDIIAFPVPHYACDFIDLLRYAFMKSQDNNEPMRDAYYQLYQKMCGESARLCEKFPIVAETLRQVRITPLSELKARCSDSDYVNMFNLPDDFDDSLEVLQFVASRKELKTLHKRLFKQAESRYADSPVELNRIKDFQPKSFLGF